MKLEFNLNGHPVTITADPDEAAKLFNLIASQPPAQVLTQSDVSGQVIDDASDNSESASFIDSSASIPTADDASLRRALMYMKGQQISKALQELANSPTGCLDQHLKQSLDVENLAPVFSHLAKVCSKLKVPKEVILVRKTRRGRNGQMRYHYSVTEQARRLILSIEDFDKINESDDVFQDLFT